jgi:hypothetical protein
VAHIGGGPQPVKIPDRQHSEPPIRGPEQQPGGGRMIWEQVRKWGAIGLVVFFLGLFVYLVIFGLEPNLTDAQVTQTQVARNSDNK